MTELTKIIQEAGGKPSLVRVVSLLLAVVVVGTWAEVSIVKQALQPLDWSQVALALGGIGVKAWQKRNYAHQGGLAA
ncbi:MAG: hypothetical protein SVS15_04105, partial [Thermodesulfobacteriota bacterium]|nr:hypothetical protein [Thermodesulfobacteriota bacterium]